MAGVLFAFPSSNVAPTATPSWAVGTEASGYDVENVLTLVPGDVAKANETTATLRLMFSGNVTPVALVFIHTNWGGASSVTVTNGGSMAPQSVTIRETRDGLCECGWVDLRGVANTTDDQWDIAVAGADGPVAIGSILVLTSIESPRTKWEYLLGDWAPKVRLTPANAARDFIFSRPTRRRSGQFVWHWAEDRPLWRRLWEEAYSTNPTPFPVIPDEDDGDAMLVQFTDDRYRELYAYFSGSFADSSQSGIVERPIEVLEEGAGAPLA